MPEDDENTPMTPEEVAEAKLREDAPEETPKPAPEADASAEESEPEDGVDLPEPDADEEDHLQFALDLARQTAHDLVDAVSLRSRGRGKMDAGHVDRLTARLSAYSQLALAESSAGNDTLFPGPGREGTTSISYFSGTSTVREYDENGEERTPAAIEYVDGSPVKRGEDGVPILEDKGQPDPDAEVVEVEGEPVEGGKGSNVPVETPVKQRAPRKR